MIIASVLAAFGIQAWWDDRLERKEEGRVLSALLDEILENQAELERMTLYHEEALENTSARIQAGAGPTSSASSDSIDVLLSHASGWQVSSYNRSALDLVLMGGKLRLISSPVLARALTRWQRELELGVEFERDHKDFMWQTWMPFLRMNASIPQISNAQTHQLGGGEAYTTETLVAFSEDHSALPGFASFTTCCSRRIGSTKMRCASTTHGFEGAYPTWLVLCSPSCGETDRAGFP